MSQVKNLRAMFESKGDTSPPDSRGRSPTAASATSEGPRPLSKIRTSFVAVEKDGRIGLKRDQSGDSSVSRRRLSNDTEPSLYRTRSKMSTHDDSVRTPAPESIPEAPDAAELATEQPSNGSERADNLPAKPKEATPAKAAAASRPSPTASKTATKPVAPKTEPAKRSATKPVASTRATGGTTATKKPAPVKTGATDAGFVKPKPKSPTKPVNLPSSLMAPTAASAHKGGAARQSILPQSASAHAVGGSTSKPVKRQGSVAGRQRPSLGVPSTSKPPQESSSSKRQSHVDEGFLARMMRPTAASSSKTTEKGAPATPPKKTAPRTSNVGPETVKHTAKSPVVNRAGSAARSREATSRAEKTVTKPTTTKTASSVAKAAAVPAAAATAAVAGAAAVASKVLADSTTSKLADKLQDLGIEEPKAEPKEKRQPEPEPEVPEPEAAEDVPTEEVQPEIEVEEPDPEHETVEELAEEPETVEHTHTKVEEEHKIAPVEHIEEPEPITKEEELVAEEINHESVIDEDFEPQEEPALLEEAALEAAQVETAEEAIEIAEEAEKHPASFDDVTKPNVPVIEHHATKESVVGNGHADKVGNVAETEPASTLHHHAETTSERADKAAEEVIGNDADKVA